MPYSDAKFIQDVNNTLGATGQLFVMRKGNLPAIRANVDSLLKISGFWGSTAEYKANGKTEKLSLGDVESINGIARQDYYSSY